MHRNIFITTFLTSWLFISETLIRFPIAYIYESTYEIYYTDISSYLMSTMLRAIPYAVFGIFLYALNIKRAWKMGVAWGGLLGLSAFLGYAYWTVEKSYLIDGNLSSTHALSYLFIPIYAFKYLIGGSIVGGFITKLSMDKTLKSVEE